MITLSIFYPIFSVPKINFYNILTNYIVIHIHLYIIHETLKSENRIVSNKEHIVYERNTKCAQYFLLIFVQTALINTQRKSGDS